MPQIATHYTILASLATFGIFLMILTNILAFDFTELGEYHPLEPLNVSWYANWRFYAYYGTKIFNWVNTFICIVLLTTYYMRLTDEQRRESRYTNKLAAFTFSGLWRECLVETLILLYTPILPLPFGMFGGSVSNTCPLQPTPLPSFVTSRLQCHTSIRNYYTLTSISDKVGLVMFLRLYMWARVLRDHSTVYKNRDKIVRVFERRKRYLPLIGWRLVLRIAFAKHTFLFLVGITSFCLLFCSFAIWLADRGDNDNISIIDASNINLLWFVAGSMMSIGYGDYTPKRYVGKLFTVVSCFLGQVLISMLTAWMVHSLSPSDTFIMTGNYLDLDDLQQKRFVEAIRLLQVSWLYKKGKCGFRYMKEQKRIAVRRIHNYSKRLFHLEAAIEGTMRDVALKELEVENAQLERQVGMLQAQVAELVEVLLPGSTPTELLRVGTLRKVDNKIKLRQQPYGKGGEEGWR